VTYTTHSIERRGIDRPKAQQKRIEESQEMKYTVHPVIVNANGATVDLIYDRFVTVHTRERGDGTDTYDWIEDVLHLCSCSHLTCVRA